LSAVWTLFCLPTAIGQDEAAALVSQLPTKGANDEPNVDLEGRIAALGVSALLALEKELRLGIDSKTHCR
jgi:hypothetical protein